MELREEWKKYQEQTEFNYSYLPKEIIEKGKKIIFQPKQFIISRGEFPKYVYFIVSGTALELEIIRMEANIAIFKLIAIMDRKKKRYNIYIV